METLIMYSIGFGIIFGAISSAIGGRKTCGNLGGFLIGFFLGIIGLIIVLCLNDVKNNNNVTSDVDLLIQERNKGNITQEQFDSIIKKLTK